MAYTLDWRVWLEVLFVLAAGVALCRHFLPLSLAVAAVGLRVGLTVGYFTYDFHGYWVGGDGLRYFYGGLALLTQGYNPVTAVTTNSGLLSLHAVATGSQITYFWWNLLLIYLFGARFCVPVVFNTGLSFLAAYYVYRSARWVGAAQGYASALGLVMLLHPEIVGYTSIANYKDVLVYCLTVVVLYYLLTLTRQVTFTAVAAVGMLSFAMLGLRFYVPVVELGVFGLWTLMHERSSRRWWLLPVTLGAALVAARYINFLAFLNLVSLLLVMRSVGYGFVHMLLTPRPYALPFWESFLYWPAVCNWVGMPFAVLGGWALWRESREARFWLLYLLAMLLIFAFFPFFQDYREQFQYYFIMIWAQFHGGWLLARGALRLSTRMTVRPAGGTAGELRLPLGAEGRG